MGTTAEKLTYLNETKTQLKDMLNLGGASLTTEPFRQYVDTLKNRYLYFMNNGTQEVWDNWEKVVGEGTTITLNNTEEAPMSIVYKGNTHQDSTTGKNLLSPNTNKNATSSNGITYTPVYDGDLLQYVNVNGTASADSSYLIQNASRYDINNTKSYIFTGCPSGGSSSTYSVVIYYYDENNGYLGGVYDTGTGRTIPTASKILTNIYIKSGQTINNLKFYPMLRLSTITDTTYEPYTGGIPAPNPDYPQDIHVVSGDNEINVVGKNLYNDRFSDYTRPLDYLIHPITLEQGQKYTLKATLKGTKISGIVVGIVPLGERYQDFSTRMFIAINSGGNVEASRTITIDETWVSPKLIVYCSPSTLQTTFEDIFENYEIQLEKGSTATEYQEYQGQQSYNVNLGSLELCKIGTYQDKIDKSSGKNLLDLKNFLIDRNATYTENSEGNYTIQGITELYAQPFVFSDTDIPVSLNGIIDNGNATNVRIQLLKSNNEVVGEITSSSNSALNKNASKLRLNWSTNGTFTLKNIMLNEGTTALEYEPYGTGWYVKKEIGKVVLDGSESWNKRAATGNSYGGVYIQDCSAVWGTKTSYTNYFAYNVENAYNGTANGYGIDRNGQVMIGYPNMTSLADFKTWLSSNNVEVRYVLATPTYTEITDSTLLSQLNALAKSYNSQTNISQENNDLPFIINATALREMS